jgi:PAS domain S-box-containing protein
MRSAGVPDRLSPSALGQAWLPLAAFAVILLLAAVAAELLGRQERLLREQLLEQQVETLASLVRDSIAIRDGSVYRMALRQGIALDEAERARYFDADANQYLREYPSIAVFARIGPDGRLQQVRSRDDAPAGGVGERLDIATARDQLAIGALDSDGPVAAWLALLGDRRGAIFDHPIRYRDQDGGLLVAVMALDTLVPSVLDGIAPQGRVRISQDGEVLYARGSPGAMDPKLRIIDGPDRPIHIELWPRTDASRYGVLSWIMLFGGLSAGALLALAVRLAAVARERAGVAEAAGHALHEQMQEAEQVRTALGEAEQELGGIFESISDAFYTLDHDWRFVMVNPQAEKLMQRARGELVGQVVWDAFPEALGSEIERQFRLAASERRAVEFEVYFLPLAAWFTARAFPHPKGLAVYFQDTSLRKRAELALLKSSATSERAQRLARLGSWEYDLTTGDLHWSEETLRIFGLRPADVSRGLPALIERVHHADRESLQEAQRRLHAGGGDLDIEYRVLRPDGDVRIVRELGTLVRDDQGEPAFAAGAIQDITEQRRTEEALKQMARRLEQSLVMNRLVMDNSLDVICALDANGRFSQVSAASLEVWGHPAHELVGRALVDLAHPDDRGATLRAAAEIRAGRPTLDFRNRIVTRDGQVRTMQWSAVWSQRDHLMFTVARDVTEAEKQSRALVDAKESLLRAQKVARMGAWELDIERNRLQWSQHVYEIFRVGEHEFEGTFEAFASRVHPDDLPELLAQQARALAGEAEVDIEHRILLPDGTIGYVHERARLLRDDQGKPWLLSGSVQDVTERRHQEARLRDSEQRMRTIVESAFDCIVSMDAQGRVVEFNPAAERTFGYRREETVGKLLGELIVPPALREAHRLGLERYLASGEGRVLGRRLAMTAVRADGSELAVELSITRLGGEGSPVFTGFIRDVTDALRAQRLEAGQRDILAGIAARRPLLESLEALTRLFEAQHPGAMCSVMLLDEAGERVLCTAAPSLPSEYCQAIHGQAIGEARGSCGTAAHRGERVIVSDIANDPLWRDFADLAAQYGLRACWSTPVKSGDGRVQATFATYYPVVQAPTPAELAVIDTMAAIAATAIDQDRAYNQLQLSEQRFRSLFDEHPDAVYSMDLEGHFTAFNGHFRELTQADAARLIGRRFDERVAPESVDMVREHFRAAAAGEGRTYEMTGLTLGGEHIDVRVTNLPIVVQGRVTGVFGIAQDISLLRQQQRALAAALSAAEQNSQQLRRLSEAAIAVNRNVGHEDLYQQLADQLRETLGTYLALLSLSSGRGHAQAIHAVSLSPKYDAWRDFDPAPDGSGIYALVCETNRPMRLTQAELESHPRWRGFGAHSGSHPPLRGWLAVPLIASDGSNLGLLQLSDKQAGDFSEDDELVAIQFAQMASIAVERAALIERLSVRDRFFEMSLEVFVIFDPAQQRFLQVNPVLCDITGYSREELCGRDFKEFIHPDDWPAAEQRASRLAARELVTSKFSNRYICRDGSVRWFEWASSPAPDGLIYGVGRDITERQNAEVVLRQTMVDLNNRNRELQDFAFIASHDLQEPLRKIRAFSDRLQQRFAAELTPEARDYLDRSGQAAARMQILIDDLLAYSRVARGKPFVPVDLGPLLATVLEDLEARLESSGGRVEVGPLPEIEGDPTQLRQVFQNLLANALKFRSPDRPPEVSLSATPARVDGEPGWEFRVDDNGIGFEPKYAERIFGPFQRLHGRQDYEGTGIGLAIVRRIVERHRGHVRADGRPGVGASFVLSVPARQPAVPGSPPSAGEETE